jgi:hypothetical protein
VSSISATIRKHWIPAFSGMTEYCDLGLFTSSSILSHYNFIKFNISINGVFMMKNGNFLVIVLLLFSICCFLPAVRADDHHKSDHQEHNVNNGRYSSGHFIGHDCPHMTTDRHGCVWRHGNYRGRIGWWWIDGGKRYFFVVPYPYPDVVPEIEYELQVNDPSSPQEEASNYWYYCENPKGYYPDVEECPDGWMTVLPQP